MHVYKVRPRRDHRRVDLISDALPFGHLWYGEPNSVSNVIGYAQHYSRSNDAVMRVYDDAGNVTHDHVGGFKEWWAVMFEISINASDSLLFGAWGELVLLQSRQQIIDFDISTTRLSVALQPP